MTDPTQIKCAAIRVGPLVLSMPRPARHHEILQEYWKLSGHALKHGTQEQGFLNDEGDFVTREGAARIMNRPGKLFSEDLW